MSKSNLISATLSPADLAEIQQSIATVEAKCPFLISLTPEQRQGNLKLGDKTMGFIDKAIDYSVSNPALLPSWLDLTELSKDYKLFCDLRVVTRLLRPLLQKMDDTATEAGIEALSAAIVFYRSVKEATKQNIPGARAIYEDLQKRFPGGGTKTTDAAAPEQ